MTQVKVSGLFYPEALPKVRYGKKKRDGYCKNCGKKLTDKESLARGFGHECFSKIPVAVILQIPAGGTTSLAPDAVDSAVSTSLVQADSESTSQTLSSPQRG